jgi:hypothetical protein
MTLFISASIFIALLGQNCRKESKRKKNNKLMEPIILNVDMKAGITKK